MTTAMPTLQTPRLSIRPFTDGDFDAALAILLSSGAAGLRRYTPEVGLFYRIALDVRGKGYATEAARALVTFAFEALNLERIVATTTYDNGPSMAVMRKLGMRVERNPRPAPVWFQVVGILDSRIESRPA